jgi:hypothetical protein
MRAWLCDSQLSAAAAFARAPAERLDIVLANYTDVAQEDLANPHMMPPTRGIALNPFMEAARIHASRHARAADRTGSDSLDHAASCAKPAVNGR